MLAIRVSELIKGFGPFTNPLKKVNAMDTYDLTPKALPAFDVVENGPDAMDYVVDTVKGENSARL
ncbi:TPA: hypothetical protein QDZ66_000617 [Pluralibacter gergoviae]|uniref:hypothetical protein n=1 Tax=Pluralibacter gergoviae TaxID=61647 RepID=UPI000650BB1F|nr:hypothetical protein [Pluralibacter gergoviae]KMK18500.1 hypothetical protein ABW10_24675 [Pluralibacter gergoviae]MBL3695833.1 hypothetical protein [Pluralibacter gergoviae]HDS1149902.1 hypothetical protein [Pluralibacter gergoviae]